MSTRFTTQIALLVTTLIAVACSSSEATSDAGASCIANPTLCPAGQTCWPTSSSAFACIPSATGATVGSSCVEKIAVATCGDGMLCDATNPDGEGQCTTYCASSASCSPGQTCQATSVAGAGGASISICRAAAPTTSTTDDGGTVVIFEDGGVIYPDATIFIPDGALSNDAAPIQR